jgi:septation ring formation regulator EzrA
MKKILIIILIVIFIIGLAIFLFFFLRKRKKNKLINGINELEFKKNELEGRPVLTELSKIEEIAKSEQLEEKVNEFKERYSEAKERLSKITDQLVSLDEFVTNREFKEYYDKYSEIEAELYEIEAELNNLLEEIDDIASYEEKYRDIVTKLKVRYRTLEKVYANKEESFGDIKKVIKMQLENIEKRFADFDLVMEEKLYNEVILVVKSIDTMIDHLGIVMDELPDILLLLNDLIPGRIEDLKIEYDRMIEEGYPLEYLDFPTNIEKIEKHKNDIYDRAKVLNITDSLFDAKVILEYLDGLFKDLEVERNAKKTFDINNEEFAKRLKLVDTAIKDVYNQMDDIKALYGLKESDLEIIDNLSLKTSSLNKDYKKLLREVKKGKNSYVKENIDFNVLITSLDRLSDEVDRSIKSLGSMYEDEVRAREELQSMSELLVKCRSRVRNYQLPIIHDDYFIEVSEAEEAIEAVKQELESKPIIIKTLNMRVETAHDLIFKLNNRTNDLIKYAYFTELMVVYSNKFKKEKDLSEDLSKVELLYSKGDYKGSYDLCLKIMDSINPNSSKKINKICNN